jgi:hypothetical protein
MSMTAIDGYPNHPWVWVTTVIAALFCGYHRFIFMVLRSICGMHAERDGQPDARLGPLLAQIACTYLAFITLLMQVFYRYSWVYMVVSAAIFLLNLRVFKALFDAADKLNWSFIQPIAALANAKALAEHWAQQGPATPAAHGQQQPSVDERQRAAHDQQDHALPSATALAATSAQHNRR